MRRLTLFTGLATLLISFTVIQAQAYKPVYRAPQPEVQAAAKKMCTVVFENLKAGKTAEIADWIVAQLGYSYSEAEKMTKRNDFKSKLDLVLAGPPASPYGKPDGFDILDEAYLPGSGRYFRHVYISYHQKAPLVWEFRFYVGPDNQVALTFITWSEKNPFEYLASSDMRLPSSVGY